MNGRINQVSITPTVARQTPRNEFGEVLKNTLEKGAGFVSGALLSTVGAGVPVVSAAISSVTKLLNSAPAARSTVSAASTGVVNVNSGTASSSPTSAVGATLSDPSNLGGMGDYISQMRGEADRSLMVQMQMQNESRDYNTVSNVLKVRHDSAKSAINNIR